MASGAMLLLRSPLIRRPLGDTFSRAGEKAFFTNYSLLAYEQPVVLPHVSHFKQVPFRTKVKLAHSGQLSPT